MTQSNNDTTGPVILDLTDEQFEQMDKFGVVLKSESNELSVPAGNSMEAVADLLKNDEIYEITLADRLVQVRELIAFLYETIAMNPEPVELSSIGQRGLGEILGLSEFPNEFAGHFLLIQ